MKMQTYVQEIEKRAFYIAILLACFLLYAVTPFIPYINLEAEIFLTIVYSLVVIYFMVKLHLKNYTLLISLILLIVFSSFANLTLFSEILTNVLYLGFIVEVIKLLYLTIYEK